MLTAALMQATAERIALDFFLTLLILAALRYLDVRASQTADRLKMARDVGFVNGYGTRSMQERQLKSRNPQVEDLCFKEPTSAQQSRTSYPKWQKSADGQIIVSIKSHIILDD
jgi:hypothetical protein